MLEVRLSCIADSGPPVEPHQEDDNSRSVRSVRRLRGPSRTRRNSRNEELEQEDTFYLVGPNLRSSHGHRPGGLDTSLHFLEEERGSATHTLSAGHDRPRDGGGGKTVLFW